MTSSRLVARGRTADVFEDGPDRVWRRYRDGRDCAQEASVMRHLIEYEYPVPQVFDATGPAMLLERISGQTLAQHLATRPWRLRWAGQLMRSLLEELAKVPVPADLRSAFGGGDCLLHLDFHPQNILLGPGGPVVIDWENVARGPAAIDLAKGWLLIETSELGVPRPVRPIVRKAQSRLANHLLPESDPARRLIVDVAEQRLTDPNIYPAEEQRIRSILRGMAPRGVDEGTNTPLDAG